MTPAQHRVLDFVSDFIAKERYSPSFQEIATGLGLASIATVHKHVVKLRQMGALSYRPGEPRSMTVVQAEECRECAVLRKELERAYETIRQLRSESISWVVPERCVDWR
jgi:SOS-response transcriptional repressor LexA